MPVQLRNAELVELLTADFLRRASWHDWTPLLKQGAPIPSTGWARYEVQETTVRLCGKLRAEGNGITDPVTIEGIPTPLKVARPGLDTILGSGLIVAGRKPYVVGIVAPAGLILQFVGSPAWLALAVGDTVSFTVSYERAEE